MGGLSRICKIYGGIKTVSNGKTVNWEWDYATDEAVKESEMPQGSERWKASEKAAGFEMPGGTATLAEARDWLRAHPNFSTTNYIKKTRASATAISSLPANNVDRRCEPDANE